MSPPAFWPATLVDYAQIVGALATAGAVIVSLWIALRTPKPVLRVSVDIRMIIYPGSSKAPRPEFLTFSAINTGPTVAKITNVGWRHKRRFHRARWGIQDVSVKDPAAQSSPMPVRLEHGEEAMYMVPLQGHQNWFEAIAKSGFFEEVATSRECLEGLNAVIFTSVGANFYAKPSKGLLDRIWSAQQEYIAAKAGKGG